MEEAARTRRAARSAVTEVEPQTLRQYIYDVLDEGTMAAGALALYTVESQQSRTDPTAEKRAAGVQLIYDGLRLTRELARTDPWHVDDDHDPSNLALLAADVMVSKGFSILAGTAAGTFAVELVRRFGRQSRSLDEPDDRLEADTLELALLAGGPDPDSQLEERIRTIGDTIGTPLPPADQLLRTVQAYASHSSGLGPAEDHVSDD